MTTLLTILHVIMCGFLMLTVLLQSGKGGGMGGAFGGGNAATVFGGSGASSFLKRLTAGAAVIFMCTSMVLAYISSHAGSDALEKWGEQQADLAKKKEDARQSALTGSGSAGSGSAGSLMFKVPGAGSGTGSAAGSGSGSGNAPAIQLSPEDQKKLQDEMAKQLGAQPAPEPTPAGSGSAAPAPAPAPTGSGSAK